MKPKESIFCRFKSDSRASFVWNNVTRGTLYFWISSRLTGYIG